MRSTYKNKVFNLGLVNPVTGSTSPKLRICPFLLRTDRPSLGLLVLIIRSTYKNKVFNLGLINPVTGSAQRTDVIG